MEDCNEIIRNIHQGHNIRRIRQYKGIKQITLAEMIGVGQQAISSYERKRMLDEGLLLRIAEALQVEPEAIKEMEEGETTINIENSTFEQGSTNNIANTIGGDQIVHPIKEMVDLFKELLTVQRENNEILQKILRDKK